MDKRDRSTARAPEEHLHTFLRASRLVGRRLAQVFAEANAVTPREASILASLALAPDFRLRIDELSQDVIMEKSSVSRLVDRLERAGYVERLPSDQDRRGVYAAMTSEGRNALRHVTRVFRPAFDDIFLSVLSPAELDQLTDLLGRVYLGNLTDRNPEIALNSGVGPAS
jgi:DNA-binding MarR family transcriptional regulator